MTQIAITYARALYVLAKEEQLTGELLQQMETLRTAFDSEPGFCRLLSASGIAKAERLAVIDGSFRGKLHPYTLNFLKILTQKGRISAFADCVKAYRSFYNEDHGILQVRVTTAAALTDSQRSKLEEKLSAITGKTAELICRTDPRVLGGVCLDYDGKRLDGTVKSRLEGLAAALKNTIIG